MPTTATSVAGPVMGLDEAKGALCRAKNARGFIHNSLNRLSNREPRRNLASRSLVSLRPKYL